MDAYSHSDSSDMDNNNEINDVDMTDILRNADRNGTAARDVVESFLTGARLSDAFVEQVEANLAMMAGELPNEARPTMLEMLQNDLEAVVGPLDDGAANVVDNAIASPLNELPPALLGDLPADLEAIIGILDDDGGANTADNVITDLLLPEREPEVATIDDHPDIVWYDTGMDDNITAARDMLEAFRMRAEADELGDQAIIAMEAAINVPNNTFDHNLAILEALQGDLDAELALTNVESAAPAQDTTPDPVLPGLEPDHSRDDIDNAIQDVADRLRGVPRLQMTRAEQTLTRLAEWVQERERHPERATDIEASRRLRDRILAREGVRIARSAETGEQTTMQNLGQQVLAMMPTPEQAEQTRQERRARADRAWQAFAHYSRVAVPTAPSWFSPTLIESIQTPSNSTGEVVPVFDQHLKDLALLQTHFITVAKAYSTMIREYPWTEQLQEHATQETDALDRLDVVLNILPTLLWDVSIGPNDYHQSAAHMSSGHPYTQFQKIQQKERRLERVRDSLRIAEDYLVTREQDTIRGGSTFPVYASRYERARLRCKFQQVLSEVVTPHLKGIADGIVRGVTPHFEVANYENDVMKRREETVSALEIQQGMRDDDCQICYEDLNESDMSRVVTYACCRRAFHVDCLLLWLLTDFHRTLRHDCPQCRVKVDLEYLGQVLEVKVRELNVL